VSIYFAGYEHLKSRTSKWYNTDKEHLPFYQNLMNSFVASSVSAAVTCPLDVVKTRIQVQDKSRNQFDYKNSWDALMKIVRNEGVSTLFKGVGARMLCLGAGSSIMMAACKFSFSHTINAKNQMRKLSG
jgi:hypothetical protein